MSKRDGAYLGAETLEKADVNRPPEVKRSGKKILDKNSALVIGRTSLKE